MVAIVLSGTTALAGGRHFFGPQADLHRRGTWAGVPQPTRAVSPYAFYPVYVWVPVPVVYVLPAPPPPTEYVEQEPVRDPARFPWHAVTKVQHYWLEVDALQRPMKLREEPPDGGGGAA